MDAWSSKDEIKLVVVFGGRVQGVGFRFTAETLARTFQIRGFVRNEWDGTVRLEAEGARGKLEAYLAELQGSRLGRYITDTHCEWQPASGAFAGFEIRY